MRPCIRTSSGVLAGCFLLCQLLECNRLSTAHVTLRCLCVSSPFKNQSVVGFSPLLCLLPADKLLDTSERLLSTVQIKTEFCMVATVVNRLWMLLRNRVRT